MSAEELEKIVARNRRVCLVFCFLQRIFLGGSIMTTYYLDRGLTQTQVFVLQTVLSVVSVGADIPFGRFADHFGIRKVLIVGSGILVCQSVGFAFCTTFWQFALALVGTGLYVAALGNTTNAAMSLSYRLVSSDSLKYRAYQTEAARYGLAGYMVGMLAGGYLATFDLAWPFWLQPIISVACLICAFRLIDPGIKTVYADNGLIIKSLRLMLLERRDIRYAIYMQSGFHLYVTLTFWVLQPRMEEIGVPMWLYGIVYIYWAGGTFILTDYGKGQKASESHRLWLVLVIGSSLSSFAAIVSGPLGFGALMVGLTLISSFALQLFNSYLEEALPRDSPALNTELAIGSTIPTLVFALVAPLYGMLTDAVPLSVAMGVAAVACSGITGCSYILFRKELKR